MPHYKDGTAAKVNDVVRGKGYNVKDAAGNLATIVGTVVGVTPGSESCNIQVAHVVTVPLGKVSQNFHKVYHRHDGVAIGCGPEGGADGNSLAAFVELEYGQCDHFERIA